MKSADLKFGFWVKVDSQALAQECSGVSLRAGEDNLVNLTVRILCHHGASCTVGSDWATTMTDGQVAAGETILVLNQTFRPLDELPSRSACFEHPGEVRLPEDVAKEVLRVAGDPAVALGDCALRVHRNELVGTILFPDARQTRSLSGKMVD